MRPKTKEEEKLLREWRKVRKDNKITIRLEQKGRYLEKELTPKMVCALFDLQFMFTPDCEEVIELNKIDKELDKFFGIMGHIDGAMHGSLIGRWDEKKEEIVWKMDKKHLYGKPEWKEIRGVK